MEQEQELQVITAKVNDLMLAVTAIQVIDEATNTRASQILGWIKQSKKKVEDTRKFFTDPLNKQVKAINEKFKESSKPLDEADKIINKKMLDYFFEKQEKIRKAQAELEAELERKKAEARELGMGVADIAPVPVEKPVSQAVKTDFGTSFTKESWDFEIVEPSKIPDEYWSINESAIREAVRSGVREIPGVKIENKTTLVHRT